VFSEIFCSLAVEYRYSGWPRGMIICLKIGQFEKKKGVGSKILLVTSLPREQTLLQIIGKLKCEFYSNLKDFTVNGLNPGVSVVRVV